MSYDPGIPTTGHSASQDYLQMQYNFTEIANAFQANHLPLASASNDGFHTLVNLVAPLMIDPNKPSPIASVYTKTVSGASQLFYQNGNMASNVIPLTATFSGLGTAASPYACKVAGIIINFGSSSIPEGGPGSLPIMFTIPYTANNSYSPVANPGQQNVVIQDQSVASTGFTVAAQNTGGPTTVYFLAIGF